MNTRMSFGDLILWDTFHFADENLVEKISGIQDSTLDASDILVLGIEKGPEEGYLTAAIIFIQPGWEDAPGIWPYPGVLCLPKTTPVFVSNKCSQREYVDTFQRKLLQKAIESSPSEKAEIATSVAIELLNYDFPRDDVIDILSQTGEDHDREEMLELLQDAFDDLRRELNKLYGLPEDADIFTDEDFDDDEESETGYN